MKSYQKRMRFYCVSANKYRAIFIIGCAMLMILAFAYAPSSICAQMRSGKADFIGKYRFSGQRGSHLEFVARDGKLIATRVYDSPGLKELYGEKESFFVATLDGREFSGIMTVASEDKGLPISGKISSDKRTIEWEGRDAKDIQYTSIVYREEQEEAGVEPQEASDSRFTQEMNLGVAAYKNKQYDEAIAHHEKALQIDPQNKDAFRVYCALGANYFRKGLLDEALTKTQKCLELNADYGIGHGFMGDLLSKRGNRTSACMYYKKGCDLGAAFSCSNYKSQCLTK